MDPPPPPRGILRLNPQAAPFQPPPSASVSGVAASRAPVASVPPSSGVAAKNKKNKNKNKQKDAPGRKKGQRDNFGPKGLDKPVPPPPVPVVAASAPPVQSVKPVQPAVVLVLNEKKKSRPRARPGGNNRTNAALTELGKDLTRKLESGRYECVICMASIGKKAQVWSCSNCFVVLHLACVKTWASKSGGLDWRCPHCQFVMVEEPKHICYCGKTVRPDADPYLVVNSCGEVCERLREGTDCPHTCNLVCHPGPCPPCPLLGPVRTCHCGKKEFRLKCSETEPPGGTSCGEVCGKAFGCEMHRCERPCHLGPCGECPHSEEQSCFCGANDHVLRPCGSGQGSLSLSSSSPVPLFACGGVCGRSLRCEGGHTCAALCHPGPCEPCLLASRATCPCGRMQLSAEQRSCARAVPLCGALHDVVLPCGHRCQQLCHEGPCVCPLTSKRSCRCRSSKQDVPCAAPLDTPVLCHQTCSTLRSCGKHQCNTRCCPSFKDPTDEAGMHVCRLPCSKKLRCGRHVCEESCHKGRCAPCHNASFEDWSCPCGKTVVLAPIACGQQMPSCPHPCRAPPRLCGHVDALPHPCHPIETPCPPCVTLVDAACACGAEMRSNVRCHLARSVSCGRPCLQPLECGRHKCQAPCHKHPARENDNNNNNSNDNVVVAGPRCCSQACLRPLDCGHPCQAVCHEGPCPVGVVCDQKTALRCECGRQSKVVPCGLKHGDPEQQKEAIAARPLLPCDDVCAKEIRKKQLAQAFGKQHQNWTDAQALIGLAKTHPTLLRRAEANLANLVLRNSGFVFEEGAIVPNVVFPGLTAAQRKLVHLLAESFGLKSESFGEEAQRSVWVTLRPGSRLPTAPLSSVLENQQREAEARTGLRAADCGVLLSQMSPSVKTQHIQAMVQPWKNTCVIHWLDDHSCLVVFDDPATARVAVNTLRGPFVATIYKEEQFSKVPMTVDTKVEMSSGTIEGESGSNMKNQPASAQIDGNNNNNTTVSDSSNDNAAPPIIDCSEM